MSRCANFGYFLGGIGSTLMFPLMIILYVIKDSHVIIWDQKRLHNFFTYVLLSSMVTHIKIFRFDNWYIFVQYLVHARNFVYHRKLYSCVPSIHANFTRTLSCKSILLKVSLLIYRPT